MSAPDLAHVREEVVRVLRDAVGCAEPVTPHSRLLADLQLDSVGLLTLVVELEDRFRVRLEDDAASAGALTVEELSARIARCLAQEDHAS